jgi:hypothetical protein
MVLGPDGQMITPVPSTPNSPSMRLMKQVIIHSDDPETMQIIKPFWCRKCSKRYKNLNGLKYHGRVEHPEFDFEDIKGLS